MQESPPPWGPPRRLRKPHWWERLWLRLRIGIFWRWGFRFRAGRDPEYLERIRRLM